MTTEQVNVQIRFKEHLTASIERLKTRVTLNKEFMSTALPVEVALYITPKGYIEVWGIRWENDKGLSVWYDENAMSMCVLFAKIDHSNTKQ